MHVVCMWYACGMHVVAILLTRMTAAQNEVSLSYHRFRGLYFLAVIFVPTVYLGLPYKKIIKISIFDGRTQL